MDTVPQPNCRFCRQNKLLIDRPLLIMKHFFILGSIEENRPHQAMVVPHRHIETPFELNHEEWSEIGEALAFVKRRFSKNSADGFTIGWNVGAVAGQEVFHAHLHVIARFAGEPSEGLGIHALFRSTN
jgi:diadenosine tetraphosphate (Ap4A) HIT family hydrolase